jgi:hypothetical protein
VAMAGASLAMALQSDAVRNVMQQITAKVEALEPKIQFTKDMDGLDFNDQHLLLKRELKLVPGLGFEGHTDEVEMAGSTPETVRVAVRRQ